MKTLVVREFGGSDALQLAEVEPPEPGPGEVRLAVAGAAVNQIDIATRMGLMTENGLIPQLDLTPLGWDVSGTVDALGEGVDDLQFGDPVIGLHDWLSRVPGAQSEFVALPRGAVARAPRNVSLVEAAALPLTGLTAYGALEAAELRAGQSLLVTGAAGGVGGMILQLARMARLETVATAAADDEPLVRKLGASHFVDRYANVAATARRLFPEGVDAVIDAAGVVGIGAHEALRGGGTFVSLVRPYAPPPIRGTKVVVYEVYADGARLAQLAALVDAGALTLRVARRFPLEQASSAYAAFEARGLRGKVILEP